MLYSSICHEIQLWISAWSDPKDSTCKEMFFKKNIIDLWSRSIFQTELKSWMKGVAIRYFVLHVRWSTRLNLRHMNGWSIYLRSVNKPHIRRITSAGQIMFVPSGVYKIWIDVHRWYRISAISCKGFELTSDTIILTMFKSPIHLYQAFLQRTHPSSITGQSLLETQRSRQAT